MSKHLFKNISISDRLKVRHSSHKHNKIISKFQWLRFEKSNPLVVSHKSSVEESEPFAAYDMMKPKAIGLPPSNILALKPLYESKFKIDSAKYKDLQSLLDFIPPVHHQFYKNLQHGKREKKKPPKPKPPSSTVREDDSPTDFEGGSI